jgi:predicted amidohydrolase
MYNNEKEGGMHMRKIKAGAIQPRYLSIPDLYDCMSDNYRNSPEEVVENYILKQLEVTVELLEKAGQEGCDIATTCEDISGTSCYGMDITEKNIFPKLLELSVPLVEAKLSDLSRKYAMYIIGCYNKRIDGKCYNIASIFDRKGEICGEYRKTHLPPNEMWQVVEGDEINVFETDFGKIGICICYDMMFPEFVQVQSLKGAEIIFHPTAGYGWYDSIGEATLRTRANDNSVYIVTAKNYIFNGAGKSSVIDFWGQTLADAGFYENVLVTHDIDLDFPKTQPDWFYPVQTSGLAEVGIRKLMERRPELYGDICRKLHERLTVPDPGKQKELLEKIKTGQCRW